MSDHSQSIFDIIHTLPVVSHSVSISVRTPAASYGQGSKYMPDYGGVLEIPKNSLKNNSLACGLPFKKYKRPDGIVKLNLASHDDSASDPKKAYTSDCLIITPVFEEPDCHDKFNAIRSRGDILYFDSISEGQTREKGAETNYESIFRKEKSLRHVISSIKQSENFLIVRTQGGIKVFDLYEIFDQNEDVRTFGSVTEERGYRPKDACLNPLNKKILSVASDNETNRLLKLYDLSSSSRKPFYTIRWDNPNSETGLQAVDSESSRSLRGRNIPIFELKTPCKYGIQQLDCIPSHLVNMLITTGQQVALVDPRSDCLGQIYVDRSKIPSFYPIEYLRRTQSSLLNSYQFYSLSNVHIRVFDTRYPGVPVNQISHMQDSCHYDKMDLKLITYRNGGLETLCSFTPETLCFTTFDQTQPNKLVNPKSMHLPFHEPNSMKTQLDSEEVQMLGLDVRLHQSDASNFLFSTIQLASNGYLSITNFGYPEEDFSSEPKSSAEVITQLIKQRYNGDSSQSTTVGLKGLRDRDVLDPKPAELDLGFIDILAPPKLLDVENNFQSKRALERYEKMKNKLDKN